MADNESTGTGKAVATDKVTYSGDADQNVQLVRVVKTTGSEGSKTVLGDVFDRTRIQVSPTCSTSAYASGDAMGGLMTFANAVRETGGSGTILGVTIFCKTTGLAWTGLELVLFDRSVSVAADNAANSFSDADMLFSFGSIKLSDWIDYVNGSIVTRDVQRAFTLNGTSLFAQLVTRSAITLVGTTDIAVTLEILQGG